MNIKQYLPGRTTQIGLIIFSALGLIYLGYYLVSNFYSSKSEQQFIDVSLVNKDARKENLDYYKDTDGDGAYDWEEALWPELDPNNPDSDGDGVSDGRYIKAKTAIKNREQGLETKGQENLTETQKLGRGTLSALLAISDSGEEITLETQNQISKNIEQYIRELTLGEKIYTRDEFRLVEDTQKNSYAYRDQINEMFRKYPVATRDIEQLIQGIENPQESQGRLRTVANKYKNYLGELTTIEVPYLIAGRHTELVNNISQIAGATNNLLQDESDELVTLSLIVQLEGIMNKTAEAIIKINTYFEIIEDTELFEPEDESEIE